MNELLFKTGFFWLYFGICLTSLVGHWVLLRHAAAKIFYAFQQGKSDKHREKEVIDEQRRLSAIVVRQMLFKAFWVAAGGLWIVYVENALLVLGIFVPAFLIFQLIWAGNFVETDLLDKDAYHQWDWYRSRWFLHK